MTTYYPERMRCPDCDHGFSYMAVGSFNTFGATFYTDGYVDGPMYVDQGRLFRCPNCSKLGWDGEFPTNESGSMDDDKYDAPFGVEPIQLNDYPSLLESEPWRNPSEEAYVRIRALWAINNTRRQAPEDLRPFTQDQLENLHILMNLLGEGPQDQLLLAELQRETAKFNDCLDTLNHVNDPQLTEFRECIRALALERNTAVMKIELTG